MLKTYLIVFASVVLLTGCFASVEPEQAVSVVTTVASEASLPEQLILTGTLGPDSSIQISAKASGRIATLNHETGDRVQRGDTLARLDAATETAVSLSLQKNLSEAEKQLASIRSLYDERIKNAEASLNATRNSGQAQINLVETRLRTGAQDIGRDGESALTSTAIVLEQTVDTLDSLLGVTDKNRQVNDVFESYLGALDSTLKPRAEAALQAFLKLESAFRVAFDTQILHADASDADVLVVLDLSRQALEEAKTALAATHTLLLKSITSAAYTASDLSTHKTAVLTLGTSVEAQLAATQDLLGTDGTASSIAVLESELAQTRAAVGAQIQTAELLLENLKKEKDFKVSEMKSQITQFAGQLAVSGTSLSDTTVMAPRSGVITQQFVEAGQVVAPGLPIFELADDSKFKIIVDVPDVVAPALFAGGSADVTLDSLPGQLFAATISKVAPSTDPITKKRAVELTLARDDHLALGLFVRVNFALPEIAGIVIPASALISRYGEHFVFVVEDERAVQRQVALGSRTSQLVSIASGLAAGELVVSKGNAWLRNGDLLDLQTDLRTE